MQKAKWDIDFGNGHSLTVEIPNSACVLWSSTYKGKVYTQAYIHSQLFPVWADIVKHLPYPVVKTWERFPEASKEQGTYIYICAECEIDKLAYSLNVLFDLGAVAPSETGPAVVDVPIVCMAFLDEICSVKQYIWKLGDKSRDVSVQQQFEAFDLACKQFYGFPKDLQCQLGWYKKHVEHERDTLRNVLGCTS